jgi:DNA-binding FrmR family transcriptional regulator
VEAVDRRRRSDGHLRATMTMIEAARSCLARAITRQL